MICRRPFSVTTAPSWSTSAVMTRLLPSARTFETVVFSINAIGALKLCAALANSASSATGTACGDHSASVADAGEPGEPAAAASEAPTTIPASAVCRVPGARLVYTGAGAPGFQRRTDQG